MHLFYTENINTTNNTISLPEEEAKHCSKVLRLVQGNKVEVIDGKGNLYKTEISLISTKQTELKILETISEFGKRNFRLVIAAAPTKNIDRYEMFIEKAVEIGIDRIIPLNCRFSERKIIKSERLEKIIVSAMKQSYKAYKPEISELIDFEKFIKQDFAGQKFIAHCYDTPKTKLKDLYKPNTDCLILIGPEGDFSEKEVENAIKAGFEPISLSDSRLRTETAGIAACNTINLLNY